MLAAHFGNPWHVTRLSDSGAVSSNYSHALPTLGKYHRPNDVLKDTGKESYYHPLLHLNCRVFFASVLQISEGYFSGHHLDASK